MTVKNLALSVAEWKPLDEFPRYSVSPDGYIYSSRTKRLLVTPIDAIGYKRIVLRKEGRQYNLAVHRLVALAYCDGYFTNAQVNHIDGNKLNNYYENLEWVTASQNGKHAYALGLNPGRAKRKVLVVESGIVYPSQVACSQALGVPRRNLCDALDRANLTARGYHFVSVD